MQQLVFSWLVKADLLRTVFNSSLKQIALRFLLLLYWSIHSAKVLIFKFSSGIRFVSQSEAANFVFAGQLATSLAVSRD